MLLRQRHIVNSLGHWLRVRHSRKVNMQFVKAGLHEIKKIIKAVRFQKDTKVL